MKSFVLLLINSFTMMSCVEYKSPYNPKGVVGSNDAKPEGETDYTGVDDSDTDSEVVESEDDPQIEISEPTKSTEPTEPAVPVEPVVKPCMVPESKKGQIF